MKDIIKDILIGVLFVGLVALFFSKRIEQNQILDQIDQLTADNQQYELVVNKLGDSLTQQQVIVTNLETAIAAKAVEVDELIGLNKRKDITIARLTAEVKALNLQLSTPVEPEVITIIDTVTQVPTNYMKIPQPFKFEDKWINADITIDRKSSIDVLLVRSEPVLYLGYSKGGLFSKSVPVARYNDKNPYISVTSMKSITMTDERGFWQSRWGDRIYGFTAGIAATWLYYRINPPPCQITVR